MGILQTVNLAIGFALIVVAIIVLYRRRLNSYTSPFLKFIVVNICGIIAILIETSSLTGLWPAGYYLLFFYIAFLPAAWYHMSTRWGLHFGERRGSQRFFEGGAAVISLVLLIILIAGRSIDLQQPGSRWYVDLGNLHFWISAFMVLGVTGGMYSLETSYRSSLGLTREKLRKTFFPLLAAGIGQLATATMAMLYHQISDLMLTITFVLMAIVAMTVARHYIAYNPVEEGVILTRKGIYSSIAVVLVGIYFIIIGLVGQFLVKYNLDDGLFFSVAFLIVVVFTFMLVVASQTLRSRLRDVSQSQIPIPIKPALSEEWKEFTEEVSVLLNIEMIYTRTSRLLRRLLKIENSLFVIREAAPSPNYTMYSGDGVDRGIPGEKLQSLAFWLHRLGHPVEITTLKEKATSEAGELDIIAHQAPFEIFLLIPFIARQKFLGFWGIGCHQSNRDLTSEEIGFIEAAANPVALTILSARMTDELVTSREMESFHRISSFVMHDLKNSVAMLSMLLQNAEKNIGNPEFQKEALITINKAVERQKKIMSRLTGQKTDDKLSLDKIDLVQLIKKTLERIKFETLKSISLDFNINDSRFVIVDADKIGSVFDNLIMNAVEAMPDGGQLQIGLAEQQPPGMVAVYFKDSGKGMDEEFISTRLFKPFSSTKVHGLGIGMYQSQEIIKAHRGRIEVKSVLGQGTEFVVYLPGEE